MSDPTEARAALRLFREYRWRVGKTIHDLGGYKGLADDLGPLGDAVESALARLAESSPSEPLDVERLERAIEAAQTEHWNDPDYAFAAAIAREYAE